MTSTLEGQDVAACAVEAYLWLSKWGAMALSEASKLTTVSGEGGVVLPDGVLKKLRWSAGTTLIVEETPDGVLLKRTSPFPSTCIEDVAGMLRYEGPAKTIAEMDEGVLEEARRRFDRSRY